jgi:hypothetical protein
MVENKYDAAVAVDELQKCPEIRVCLDESEETMNFFEVHPAHMTKEIPAPISITDKRYTWADLMSFFVKSELSTNILNPWEYAEHQAQHILPALQSYVDYLESDKQCSEDVKKMVSCIVYELQTFPEKYNAPGFSCCFLSMVEFVMSKRSLEFDPCMQT